MTGYFHIDRELAEMFLPENGKPFTKSEALTFLASRMTFAHCRRRVNEKIIDLNPGEIVASERFLENAWGWSRSKVRNFKKVLGQYGVLDQRKDQGETVLILDLKRDQGLVGLKKRTSREATGRPGEDHPRDHRRTKLEEGNNEKRREEPARDARTPALSDSGQSGTAPAAPAGSGAQSEAEIMARLAQAYPKAPRHLGAAERKALAEHKAILAEMTDEDSEALRVWTNKATDQSRGCKLWPRNRSQFLQYAGEALEKVRNWWEDSGRKWWEDKEAKRKKKEAAQSARPGEQAPEDEDDFDRAEYWKKLQEKPSEPENPPDAEDPRKAG